MASSVEDSPLLRSKSNRALPEKRSRLPNDNDYDLMENTHEGESGEYNEADPYYYDYDYDYNYYTQGFDVEHFDDDHTEIHYDDDMPYYDYNDYDDDDDD